MSIIYGEGYGNFPILDMSSLNLSSDQLIEGVDNLGFFIDFNEGIEINESLVEEIIGDEISTYFLHFSVDFYNHDWNNYLC